MQTDRQADRQNNNKINHSDEVSCHRHRDTDFFADKNTIGTVLLQKIRVKAKELGEVLVRELLLQFSLQKTHNHTAMIRIIMTIIALMDWSVNGFSQRY